MGVNRYKNHLVIYLEDKPYRGIVNGFKNVPNVQDKVIDTKPPSGGWGKVFADLEDNLRLLNNKDSMYALFLMDFDNAFQVRMEKFQALIAGQNCEHRVFLLGIDAKESEDLKATLKLGNIEEVGKQLVDGCPEQESEHWKNHHLACNKAEIERMRHAGVFNWLFV